jgi:hypothetical protein
MSKEKIQKVIDALNSYRFNFRMDQIFNEDLVKEALSIMQEELDRPELEPYAFCLYEFENGGSDDLLTFDTEGKDAIPLYIEPPALKQWCPIGTAPKDGTEILLFALGDIGVCYWSVEMKGWTWGLGKEFLNPSHWMPLPEPPTK